MKGFIEIELQGVLRLVAIKSIVGITEFDDRCIISLNAKLPDFKNHLEGYVYTPLFTDSFETKVGVHLLDITKLIEDAQ